MCIYIYIHLARCGSQASGPFLSSYTRKRSQWPAETPRPPLDPNHKWPASKESPRPCPLVAVVLAANQRLHSKWYPKSLATTGSLTGRKKKKKKNLAYLKDRPVETMLTEKLLLTAPFPFRFSWSSGLGSGCPFLKSLKSDCECFPTAEGFGSSFRSGSSCPRQRIASAYNLWHSHALHAR